MYLPPEVWQCIGDHLPEYTLQKMRYLNSALFHIYMRTRYRVVSISWERTKDREKARTLRGSMFTGYVNHLKLCLSPARPPGFSKFIDDLLAAVKEMTSLSEIGLSFNGSQEDDPEELQPFFASLWSIVGPNLRSLELSGSLKQYKAYIPSHSVLPSLQKFILTHDKGYLLSLDNKIIPLINGLASQLHSLEVHDNFQALAPHLATFPALEKLKTSLWFADAGDGEIVKQFLMAQTPRSQPFRLHVSAYSIFGEDISAIFSSELTPSLPEYIQLESLELQYTYLPLCSDAIHAVIRTHCHNLTSLEFLSCGFRPAARHRLRELILTISTCTQLSLLFIDVPKLDLWLLTLLSSELPHLETLGLSGNKFDLRLVGPWRKRKSLHLQSLQAWKLHDLSICYKGVPLDNKTMKQIAQLIPSVHSFWKTGDMDSPSYSYKPYKQWRHSRFVLKLIRSAAYRPVQAGIDTIRWRLPF